MGRPTFKIELTDGERADLKSLARRGKTSQWLSLRARIVLKAAKGLPTETIAEQLGIREATVSKWRGRFARERMEGICDAPRTGRPRQISDSDIERLIRSTLEKKPRGATHWSCRLFAKEFGVPPRSRSSVRQLRRAAISRVTHPRPLAPVRYWTGRG